MNRLILILPFLFVSCSSKLILSGSGCLSTRVLRSSSYETFSFKTSFFGSKNKVKLKDLLLSEGIECRDVGVGRVTFKSDFFDAFSTLIPFYESKTILVQIYKNTVTEDSKKSKDGRPI